MADRVAMLQSNSNGYNWFSLLISVQVLLSGSGIHDKDKHGLKGKLIK